MPENESLSPGRRLSQTEVRDYIENQGARLHEEYTEMFFEDHGTAYMNNDLIYELPNGDVVYVIDPNSLINPGEGYYYTRDIFQDMVSRRGNK